jgi:hypothetical protein
MYRNVPAGRKKECYPLLIFYDSQALGIYMTCESVAILYNF